MEIVRDIEQGSDEWLRLRAGIPTASEMACIKARGKGEGGLGVGAITYLYKLIGEKYKGEPEPSFSNFYTERGHELEPLAREDYEAITGVKVEEVAFIKNHGCGYSPDGLVGNDGLIEIKTKKAGEHVRAYLTKEVPAEHIAQIQSGLWISGRDWCDYISYNEGMPMAIIRVERDEAYIRELAAKVKVFNEILEDKLLELKGVCD